MTYELKCKGPYDPDNEIKILAKLNAKDDEQYWRNNKLELIQMIECIDQNIAKRNEKRKLFGKHKTINDKLKKEIKLI